MYFHQFEHSAENLSCCWEMNYIYRASIVRDKPIWWNSLLYLFGLVCVSLIKYQASARLFLVRKLSRARHSILIWYQSKTLPYLLFVFQIKSIVAYLDFFAYLHWIISNLFQFFSTLDFLSIYTASLTPAAVYRLTPVGVYWHIMRFVHFYVWDLLFKHHC